MASTSPERLPAPTRRAVLAGWGATPASAGDVARPATRAEVDAALDQPPTRGIIARGLGRCYGDAAQNAGGRVVVTTDVSWLELDPSTGRVTASAGTSLDHLLHVLVPRGRFVPVTPGTRQVTVGGAIAADIHGKNHHKVGCWSHAVESFRLLVPSGEVLDVDRAGDPELFAATCGGMGLTGVVTDATFTCPAIETSRLLVDTERTPDLDTTMASMTAGDDRYDYTVAWIDLMATGARMGRSVITSGRFARAHELENLPTQEYLAYRPLALAGTPPLVPNGLLNRATIMAFNELWYRKAPRARTDEVQTIGQFFHPLDGVRDWNRLYGPRGFLQWQIVVPFAAEHLIPVVVERLSRAHCTSFLAVLKRFGPANDNPLSFPLAGWTLSLDIPVGVTGLGPLLDELDEVVAREGGRTYLAKDSRVRPELVPVMYPRLDEWRAMCARVDPDGVLQSDLSRRLRLRPR